ncbi:uncharacterized protein LOC129912663 [Episyrphus balteatus]|uniref:uncharacterized protein LOC129912663 n=1 Tax=Episyrphus balteatus TaxID=286459 RepID=UPI0024866609|nr:uncharacterized protein LOC129912663 [Episyrphus balteatus]
MLKNLSKCIRFTRIFGIVRNKSSYAYFPYADNPVQQLVENTNGNLPNALKDLNGYAFRTTIQTDMPRTFLYSDKNGNKQIGGRAGQIFLQFLQRHNATFKEISFNNSNEHFMVFVINATIEHQIDISMNTNFKLNNLDISYPITIQQNLIVVPRNGYLDPFHYFERPFQGKVWILIGLTVLYLTISKICLNYWTNSELEIWTSFSDIYLTLLNSVSERTITSNYRFHLQVLIFAFFLQRLYGVHFQSFLTVFIKVKQFETIQDLADNKVPVLIPQFGWEEMKTNHHYPKGFDRKNLFRKSQEVLFISHIGYMMAFNSPFKEILDDFIIGIKETGLIQKWDADVIYQAKQTNWIGLNWKTNDVEETSNEGSNKPLTIKHLKSAWDILIK